MRFNVWEDVELETQDGEDVVSVEVEVWYQGDLATTIMVDGTAFTEDRKAEFRAKYKAEDVAKMLALMDDYPGSYQEV